MLNTTKFLESFLQKQRFRKVIPFLGKNVLDFGGNNGELKRWVTGKYTLVNYDHTALKNNRFDCIVALAVIEHLTVNETYDLFKKFKMILQPEGIILMTTPAPLAKPVLEMLAFFGLLDRKNIAEHKHYWKKNEIYQLANQNNFTVISYLKFQSGFNRFIKLKHSN